MDVEKRETHEPTTVQDDSYGLEKEVSTVEGTSKQYENGQLRLVPCPSDDPSGNFCI